MATTLKTFIKGPSRARKPTTKKANEGGQSTDQVGLRGKAKTHKFRTWQDRGASKRANVAQNWEEYGADAPEDAAWRGVLATEEPTTLACGAMSDV
jgi:hypothetical protein